jgi:hypothetical protein
MTPTTMRETLMRQLDTWPDELIEYVFDFVQFWPKINRLKKHLSGKRSKKLMPMINNIEMR